MTDDDYRPDPGKVYYSAGIGFSADAPPDVLARQLSDIPDVAPQKRAQWIATTPTRDRSPRAEAKAKAAKQEPKPATRPKSGIRNPAIDITRILTKREQGKSNTEIAAEIGCTVSAISKHLAKYRQSSEAAAGVLDASRKCPTCQGRKAANVKECGRCIQLEQRRLARLVARGVVVG